MRKLFDKLYKKSAEEFHEIIKKNLINEKKMFIVTANPETFMISIKDNNFKKLLLSKDTTIVPDGIGIVKGTRMLNYSIKERIPGVEIAEKLLEFANEEKKSLYLLGSKQEVIDIMEEKLKTKYPNIKILGLMNGYSKDKDRDFKEIIEKKPDIILVALGIPAQEKLIYKQLNRFKKGIFVGVGGSLDVISGYKKRAPKIFIKLNLEWLYRIMLEPKRIKRFYDNNVKFLLQIKKYK
jgi:N-acetylglucosaminyldiphosphoundecaprenol N-acetyl-beta-D-mannosaminyltransferase